MKIAIVGTRNPGVSYQAWESILLSKINASEVSLIISGGAKGIDTYAEQWANENQLPKVVFKPEYSKYGKAAPLVRNKLIVEEADKVIAFISKESVGTIHTVNYARSKNKRITTIEL